MAHTYSVLPDCGVVMEEVAANEMGNDKPVTNYLQTQKWTTDKYEELIDIAITHPRTMAVCNKHIVEYMIAERFPQAAHIIKFFPRPMFKSSRGFILPLNSPLTRIISRGANRE